MTSSHKGEKLHKRLSDLYPMYLHKWAMSPYATFDGRGFSAFMFFYRFSGVRRDLSFPQISWAPLQPVK